jgi:alpha-mannosidase
MKHSARLVLAVLLLCPVLFAQSAQQMSDLMKSMPDRAQAVVTRLAELNHLPAGAWRVHDGDMAHGENTDLDDSSWPVAKTNVPYSTDAVWFRQWIEVPKTLQGYDLSGANLSFRFDAGASGTRPTIVYFNGRRVAMGESLEPINLFHGARPGEKVLIAVKLLQTGTKKYFYNAYLNIEFPPDRPNPDDMRQEFLSAYADLPGLSSNLPADSDMLEKATGQVDLKALDEGNQKAFDDSLIASKATLDALKPALQQATIILTGNAHIDAAWLWPWTETVDVVKRTYSTALQLMHEYPDYTFTQSAAQYNAWLAEKYPPIDSEMKQRIKEGRWEIVGGMWVEPDLNMPDGESTVRSLLIGKRWYLQHYGVDVKIGWNPDSFGYNWQLPQIYKKSGIDYFVTQKMSWSDTNQLPFRLFWWESPDGSKVLTYFPRGYGNGSLNPVRLGINLQMARTYAPGIQEMMDLYGVSDHGGGPTRAMLDEGGRWMQPDKVAPRMKFGTASSFFSAVTPKIAPQSPLWDYRTIALGYHEPAMPPAGQVAIPTWNDELYLEKHRGVFTTQANMKRNIRESEEWALNAEKYASLAWLDGDAYPGSELTDAWKKIAFNDFHDLAAGSGIGVIYKDAQKDYDQVRAVTDQISANALKTIAERIDTRVAEGVPILVFNNLAWQRSGLVEADVQMPAATEDVSVIDAAGRVLPSEVLSKDAGVHTFHLLLEAPNVPSMGYEVLHVVPQKRVFESDLRVSGTTIENADLRVVVDPKTGCITSLYDKKSNYETLAAGACGNELQAFTDKPKDFDAWDIDTGTFDHVLATLHADAVVVVEKGPLRGIVRVTRSWQNSQFVQDIELDAHSDQALVTDDIDWHETHVLLKVAFPVAASGRFATYEIPFGSIQRPTTRSNSWESARFEVPAQRWADLGDSNHGFSLINESKFGYDGVGNMLRLSLLRSPVLPDPDADRGHHHFSFALYPHGGDWKQALTVRHGYEFNYKLKAIQVEAHSGAMAANHSFLTMLSENVVVTAMKKAEDSDALIFHMYEWAGKEANVTLAIPAGATGAVETNLMEQEVGSTLALTKTNVTVPIHPYEILTIRVDYPRKPI